LIPGGFLGWGVGLEFVNRYGHFCGESFECVELLSPLSAASSGQLAAEQEAGNSWE
jgi:hypothetical protein